MGQYRLLSVYFRLFLVTISITQIEKSTDAVLGIQTGWKAQTKPRSFGGLLHSDYFLKRSSIFFKISPFLRRSEEAEEGIC